MQTVTSYSLPPDKYAQAQALERERIALHFGGFLVSALVLIALLKLRVVPRLRRWPAVTIVAIVTFLTELGDLPGEIYGHMLSLRYHISIEGWPAWFWDWAKGTSVSIVIAVATLIPLYWLIRKQPRRWWIYGWIISIPVMLVSAIADPLIFEPMFNTFHPLSQRDPELIQPIEQLLARARIEIPQTHLFEMDASEKTNALNAYVTGFGPTRRLVLYDTIIRKENGPPLLTTIGHEVGHYVLNHIAQGLAVGSLGLLFALWLLARVLPWIGPKLGIASLASWESLPLLLLATLVLGFFSEPIENAYSRHLEHQADVYSLEVTHGLIPDPGQAAAQAFQVEGETSLDLPNPNPLWVFWLYSHPPISDRVRFSLDYNPWQPGKKPQFVQ